jgi:oligoribonuclease NrnB/cAMP/cGMP phosphodiesterase (DHH superfamily)
MKAARIINITHTDLDGVGCPIVLAIMTDMKIEPHYCGYHDIEDELEKVLSSIDDSVHQIFITDISMREGSESYRKITQINRKYGRNFIQMIDHHATSQFANKYRWVESHETDAVTGEKKCATYQLFEYLQSQGYSTNYTLERFVTLVNLWDTWRWVTDYPANAPRVDASQLNMVQSIYGKKKFMSDYIRKIKNQLPMFEYAEQTIIDCKMHEIERDIQDKNEELFVTKFSYRSKKEFAGFVKKYLESNHITDKNYLLNKDYHKQFTVGIVFTSRNISDVGNGLAKLHPELDFIMLVSLPKTVSFRSVKDLDVPLGIIANHITGKGGGHPQSAGGVLSRKMANDIIHKLLSSK